MALPNPSMAFIPFAILTADEMNDLVENDQALAAGTGFNTGAIPTSALANGSVTPGKLDLDPLAGYVATNESTVSTTYAALTTVGPAVTVVIGANGLALVSLYGKFAQTSNQGTAAMGFSVSGASTQAAADNYSLMFTRATGDDADNQRIGATFLLTGLTPGSTTFTCLYKRLTATGTSFFADRRIAVVPL